MLSEALEEERGRSEAAIQRAVETTREQLQARMDDDNKVGGCGLLKWLYYLAHIHTQHSEAVRRRQLASVELFVESARAQLQSLLAPESTTSSE